MDILTMIDKQELREFSENLAYQTNFMGDKLFTSEKTLNLKAAVRSAMEGATIPVMAQVHSLDSEARIGDRPNFTELEFEKLFIKEKINTTERISLFKADGASNSAIKRFIFDDIANMVSRVLTRNEVMRMELLSTGKITIKENNVNTTVDYKVPATNFVSLGNWSNADYDILADLKKVQKVMKAKGYSAVRALTTSGVIEMMSANNGIKAYWANVNVPMTESNMLAWINDNFKIEFVANDEVYKTKLSNTKVEPFFKANTIAFLPTKGILGKGLFGVTPEELELGEVSQRMKVAVTQWKTPDPVAVWTKASELYLPVLNDPNGLFIGTIAGA